jgi:hypothetical protein
MGQRSTTQSGSGALSLFSSLIPGVAAASAFSGAYTSKAGTYIRNKIPNSDENARQQYPGEKHAILKLKNGKFGTANYMGPGTNLITRIKNEDPARTESDRVAKTHDVRYALAKTQRDARLADERMVGKLRDIERAGTDSKFNTLAGRKGIEYKMRLENMGIAGPNTFASIGGVPADAIPKLKKTLEGLEQKGYGMSAADVLRLRAIKTLGLGGRAVKKARVSGRGDAKGLLSKNIAGILMPQLINAIKAELGISSQLYGRGIGDSLRRKLSAAFKGAKNSAATLSKIASPIILAELKVIFKAGVKVASKELQKHAAKMILEFIKQKMAGRGKTKDGVKYIFREFAKTYVA